MKKGNQSLAEQKLREVENGLVNIITRLGYMKGRSTKNSKVTAYIFVRREATQKLLRELTGYSLGTISTTLRSLEKIGFVHKYQDPESREYRYKLDNALAQAGSQSMTNIFEYFCQLKEFLQEVKPKLGQLGLSDKRGFENINSFVIGMDKLLPAIEQAMRKIAMPIVDDKGEEGQTGW